MSNNEKKDNREGSSVEGDILEEGARIEKLHDNVYRFVMPITLAINAGAVLALASFFTDPDKVNAIPDVIKYATLVFLLGAFFGVCSFVFEYLAIFFSLKIYTDSFFGDFGESWVKKYYEEHGNYFPGIKTRITRTLNARLINAALAFACCFIGIFLIAIFLLKNTCLIYCVGIFLLFYIFAIACYLYNSLNHKN